MFTRISQPQHLHALSSFSFFFLLKEDPRGVEEISSLHFLFKGTLRFLNFLILILNFLSEFKLLSCFIKKWIHTPKSWEDGLYVRKPASVPTYGSLVWKKTCKLYILYLEVSLGCVKMVAHPLADFSSNKPMGRKISYKPSQELEDRISFCTKPQKKKKIIT